ncbi:hypothetical protein HMPREF3038_02143 [Akkermansia sp. KLE1797]|nr:hypothetical protein HMPREF3038_02143 [Akkermansia sp. KLE1797]KXU53522.1 hypothetical protein HMPREF3039_02243 [Akkermansia sp. KLE1798]KZA05717.1 hypothetical protein HMPREF1326_00542 [Akkermansia sp. KLE1605]
MEEGRGLAAAGAAVSGSVKSCAAQMGAASREVQRIRCEIFMWKSFYDYSGKEGAGPVPFPAYYGLKGVFLSLMG